MLFKIIIQEFIIVISSVTWDITLCSIYTLLCYIVFILTFYLSVVYIFIRVFHNV